jgi:ABC-type Fe3+ transport system substrate-binding protein
MTDMAARVTQETTAGRRTSTDILLGSEGHYTSLYNRDVLEEYDYTRLSPRITPALLAPRNAGVEIMSLLSGITYNSDLVRGSDIPRTLEDTLNPKWKGAIASTVNAAAFERVALRPEWGTERMKAFVTRLSDQVGGLLRIGENQRIVSGEFVMLVMDSGSNQVLRQRASGAPLGHVIPDDAATVGFLYLGIPRNSARPNLGKLFVNTVLSEEGQRLVYETSFADHIALPGSQSALELADLTARGIKPLEIDVQFAIEHPDMRVLTEELEKILREKRGG